MKKIITLIKQKRLALLVALTPLFCVTNAYASGGNGGSGNGNAIENAAQQASSGIQSTAINVLKILLPVILIISGAGLIFSDRKADQVKESAPRKVVGAILIISASAIATVLFGWFGGK